MSEHAPGVARSVRRRGRRTILASVAAALPVGALIGWALTVVFVPSADVAADAAPATVEVAAGAVGSAIQQSATASWPASPVAVNAASGVVTTVDVAPGQDVTVGTRLYTVALRPVVAGQGGIPAFGPVAPGDRGEHVAQLQRFLQAQGFWAGTDSGVYGGGLEAAVRAWQRAAGFPVDAVVQQPDIVWVPLLPVRLRLDADVIRVGRTVGGGEEAILQLPTTPTVAMQLQASRAAASPTGTAVEVTSPAGGVWEGIASTQAPRDDGTVDVLVTAPDGGAICGSECDQIAMDGVTSMRATVHEVPVQAGLVVPVAAIVTDESGQTLVVGEDDTQHEVTVIVAVRGIALVSGVPEGTSVLLVGAGAS